LAASFHLEDKQLPREIRGRISYRPDFLTPALAAGVRI
jgi:hypothetical protein